QANAAVTSLHPLQAAMEPLAELGMRISADPQLDIVGTLTCHDFDRTGIETAGYGNHAAPLHCGALYRRPIPSCMAGPQSDPSDSYAATESFSPNSPRL